MADENGGGAKETTPPCPTCKDPGKESVLLIKEDNVIQKQLTKIQQSSILSLPKTIDMLVIVTDVYICRTCGVRFEKIKKEDQMTGAAKYMDAQGREIDPAQMR